MKVSTKLKYQPRSLLIHRWNISTFKHIFRNIFLLQNSQNKKPEVERFFSYFPDVFASSQASRSTLPDNNKRNPSNWPEKPKIRRPLKSEKIPFHNLKQATCSFVSNFSTYWATAESEKFFSHPLEASSKKARRKLILFSFSVLLSR